MLLLRGCRCCRCCRWRLLLPLLLRCCRWRLLLLLWRVLLLLLLRLLLPLVELAHEALGLLLLYARHLLLVQPLLQLGVHGGSC